MTFQFGAISRRNLAGVHPDLVKLAKAVIAASPVDFQVVDGVRTLAEQKANLKKGVSQTLRSLHLPQKDGFSHAIDFAVMTGGSLDWYNIAKYMRVVATFKACAKDLGVPVRCGADWKTLKDYGHIELDRKAYPV